MSVYLIAASIVIAFPALKAIFCLFNWHTWDYKKGGHRECRWCKKSQSRVRIGKDQGWH
ncbi:hypothetical protein VPHK567_0333 [Vibrio phage K567]|nr:hypothetical protein MYOV011v1_p0287 [Vibrio phage 6E35.1a]